MEARLEKERRGKAPEEVENLCLDGCTATEIIGLTNDYKNLVSLSLINCGLTTLKGFPALPKLRRLDLSDNRVSGELGVLQNCPVLMYLNLSGNPIKEVDTLQPLKDLPELQNLDLFNCELSNADDYREKVFELLDKVLFLDGLDKNDQEAYIEDGEDGSEGDEDEDDDDVVGLEYLQKPNLENESDGEEFNPGEDEDEDDDLDDENEEGAGDATRGTKRKHDEGEDESSTDVK